MKLLTMYKGFYTFVFNLKYFESFPLYRRYARLFKTFPMAFMQLTTGLSNLLILIFSPFRGSRNRLAFLRRILNYKELSEIFTISPMSSKYCLCRSNSRLIDHDNIYNTASALIFEGLLDF